jgi:hypothetical protein
MAAPRKISAKRLVVVELTVLSRPDGPVFVGERLMATRDVHDGQAPRAECDAVAEMRSPVVWPAVRHDVRHSVEHLSRDRVAPSAVDSNSSADSAHIELNASEWACSTLTTTWAGQA